MLLHWAVLVALMACTVHFVVTEDGQKDNNNNTSVTDSALCRQE